MVKQRNDGPLLCVNKQRCVHRGLFLAAILRNQCAITADTYIQWLPAEGQGSWRNGRFTSTELSVGVWRHALQHWQLVFFLCLNLCFLLPPLSLPNPAFSSPGSSQHLTYHDLPGFTFLNRSRSGAWTNRMRHFSSNIWLSCADEGKQGIGGEKAHSPGIKRSVKGKV